MPASFSLFYILCSVEPYIPFDVYGKREDKSKFLLENEVYTVDSAEDAIALLGRESDRAFAAFNTAFL
ncbi:MULTISPECIES: hypothetical protein [Cyanophyceae]|uniref:hypothetical protein n=1 Tax=Cyanophyceae TaxID=3028117 RepID=UPI001684C904|nr:hypothetical protein [Trichocoleus sp. FACHB-69]MBD1935670.1 hypothetical protein [Trichocoleus sp. FACHB-69]